MTEGASVPATDLESAVGRAAGPPPAPILQLHLRAQLFLVLLHDVREVGPPAALRVVLLTMATVRLGAGRGDTVGIARRVRSPRGSACCPPTPRKMRPCVSVTRCDARTQGVTVHTLVSWAAEGGPAVNRRRAWAAGRGASLGLGNTLSQAPLAPLPW